MGCCCLNLVLLCFMLFVIIFFSSKQHLTKAMTVFVFLVSAKRITVIFKHIYDIEYFIAIGDRKTAS